MNGVRITPGGVLKSYRMNLETAEHSRAELVWWTLKTGEKSKNNQVMQKG
jgi:hypothetical protein